MGPLISQKHALIGAGIALVAILSGLAIYFYHLPPQLDAPILGVMAKLSSIDSYSQGVETLVLFPDRTLTIIGTYHNDAGAGRFASLSTTTLVIPDQPEEMREHTFTHENIAVGDDVYVRVDTKSELLQRTGTVTYGPEWRHFDAFAIPGEFTDIAVPGPIHDSLVLLSENGKYLTLEKKHREVMWGAEELLRYTFKPSGVPAPGDGSLKALLERLGASGTIDVWIDEQSSVVRHVVLANAEYQSTTTISRINTPQMIEPPVR